VAWAGSIFGEYLTLTGLGISGFGASGVAGVGLIAIAQMLPAVLVAPFAAVLGDRFRRERVLALTELVRAVASALAALAVATGAGSWAVYALAGVLGASRTAYYPAQAAIVPLLARHPHEVTACGAAFNLTKNAANLAAPALAGLMLLAWPLGAVFALGGGVFMAAATVATLRIPSTAGLRSPIRAARPVAELARGFRAAAGDPRLRIPLALSAAQGVGRGAINVLVIVIPLQLLSLSDAGAGFFSALIGLGGIAGVGVSLALVGSRRLAWPMVLGLVAMGAPYLLPAAEPVTWAAVAALLAAGVGNAVMGVAGMSLLVRESPDDVLSRVMGVQEILRAAGIIVASLGVPLLVEPLGLRTAMVVLAGGLTAVALALGPGARRLDRSSAAPPPEAGLVAASPLFGRLLPVSRERVTRRMRQEAVGAGQEVVRQGDQGDRVYLAVEGTYRVEVDGRLITTLGRGAVFGEIALLRDVPRTATVRATVPGRVLTLERDEFLSAVLGHPVATEDAERLADQRLREHPVHPG
jgi:MFS family permease